MVTPERGLAKIAVMPSPRWLSIALTIWMISGCGSTNEDPPTDAGPDAPQRDASGGIQVQGTVRAEMSAAPLPGVEVRLWDPAGNALAQGTTDSSGEYVLVAPTDTLTFLVVEPVAQAYAGLIRAEPTKSADYTAFDATLSLVSGLQDSTQEVGLTYDDSKGWFSVGFNPVTAEQGGEGAVLSATHDSAFVLGPDGSGGVKGYVTTTLPPSCTAMPSASPCTTSGRLNVVFFPNVQVQWTTVSPVNPATGTCMLRHMPSQWPVRAGYVTAVSIDCTP